MNRFICGHCKRVYANAQNCRRHERKHKPPGWQCGQCSKAFDRPDKLQRHVRSMHTIPDIAPAHVPAANGKRARDAEDSGGNIRDPIAPRIVMDPAAVEEVRAVHERAAAREVLEVKFPDHLPKDEQPVLPPPMKQQRMTATAAAATTTTTMTTITTTTSRVSVPAELRQLTDQLCADLNGEDDAFDLIYDFMGYLKKRRENKGGKTPNPFQVYTAANADEDDDDAEITRRLLGLTKPNGTRTASTADNDEEK